MGCIHYTRLARHAAQAAPATLAAHDRLPVPHPRDPWGPNSASLIRFTCRRCVAQAGRLHLHRSTPRGSGAPHRAPQAPSSAASRLPTTIANALAHSEPDKCEPGPGQRLSCRGGRGGQAASADSLGEPMRCDAIGPDLIRTQHLQKERGGVPPLSKIKSSRGCPADPFPRVAVNKAPPSAEPIPHALHRLSTRELTQPEPGDALVFQCCGGRLQQAHIPREAPPVRSRASSRIARQPSSSPASAAAAARLRPAGGRLSHYAALTAGAAALRGVRRRRSRPRRDRCLAAGAHARRSTPPGGKDLKLVPSRAASTATAAKNLGARPLHPQLPFRLSRPTRTTRSGRQAQTATLVPAVWPCEPQPPQPPTGAAPPDPPTPPCTITWLIGLKLKNTPPGNGRVGHALVARGRRERRPQQGGGCDT
eukprot:gene16083-biopygen12285